MKLLAGHGTGGGKGSLRLPRSEASLARSGLGPTLSQAFPPNGRRVRLILIPLHVLANKRQVRLVNARADHHHGELKVLKVTSI